MGWFADLFKKKKQVEVVSEAIELEKLKEWFLKRFEVDTSFSEEEVNEKIQLFNSLVLALNTERDVLSSKDLMNKKIPDRAKHAMEGNRTNYVNQLNILLNVLGKPEIDREQLRDFLDNYDEKIQQFSESSARSFYVLNEFFANEIKKIATSLKKLDDLMNGLKVIVNKDKETQGAQDEILGLIKRINSNLKLKAEKAKESAVLNGKLDESQKFKERMLQKLDDLKNSARYNAAQDLVKKRDSLESKLDSIRDEIIQAFSYVVKYLKKYERVALENEDLIKSYLDDSIKAVESDGEFVIKSILNKLKQNVTEGVIDVKDNEKLLSRMDFILMNISRLRNDLVNTKQEFLEKKKLVLGDAALQQAEDVEYRITHAQEQIDENNRKIKKCEEDIQGSDIEDYKLKVKSKVKELLHVNLTIIQNDQKVP